MRFFLKILAASGLMAIGIVIISLSQEILGGDSLFSVKHILQIIANWIAIIIIALAVLWIDRESNKRS